jgi:hypothetical protein
MKLRLQITPPGSASFIFEHQGPVLRIGRNTESELAFQGEASQSVSWNHAQIELTSQGAYLTDLNSSNGTLVNDQRTGGRTSLRMGDRIQLGYTGPVLTVMELVLSEAPLASPLRKQESIPAAVGTAPAVAGAPLAKPLTFDLPPEQTPGDLPPMPARPPYLYLGIGVAAVLILVLGGLVWWKSGQPEGPSVASVPDDPKPANKPPTGKPTNPSTSQADKSTGGTHTIPLPDPGLAEGPSSEARAVGIYLSPPKTPPSVLLQRQGDRYAWARLRPDSRVYTANYLVSLPGYRSKVRLETGVNLTLWGNVPEFSPFPPVLESTVMLNMPAQGVDLDFTLDRGRVHLSSDKEVGKAQVRVRFHHEVWDLTLPDAKTEVVLELWGLYPRDVPFSKEPGGKGPLACLGLFTKGQASLKIGNRDYTLPNASQFIWTNTNPEPVGPDILPEARLPAWWTNTIDPTNRPAVADAMLALQDFHTQLSDKPDSVVDTILIQVRESDYAPHRALGILFLAALDAVPFLVEGLENPRHPEVRGAAAFALRQWMSRNGDHDRELYRLLYEQRGYPREKAEIIMRLLHSVSEAESTRPETFATLINYLNHDNLAIRHLAHWHLTLLVPEAAKKISYDPAADTEKRQEMVAQWKKLVSAARALPRSTP